MNEYDVNLYHYLKMSSIDIVFDDVIPQINFNHMINLIFILRHWF